MKAAIVRGAGQAPVYADIPEPKPAGDETIVHVTAAAISQVSRSRASGRHYSAAGDFPFVPGIDGVGRLDNGRRVYFVLPRAPNGSMAERTAVPTKQCVRLPDNIDDVTAAAIANPGMSSWAALAERAKLVKGETVLINGATGAAGRLAVQIAKYLRAGKVIATGRSADGLREVAALGAAVTIQITGDRNQLEERLREAFAKRIDVVLDYLWGPSAEAALIAAAKATPDGAAVRYVEIGAASGQDITLPSAVLRSSAITLMGSGIGSVPPQRLLAAIEGVLKAAPRAGFKIATQTAPLAEIEQLWARDGGARRTVVTMGG